MSASNCLDEQASAASRGSAELSVLYGCRCASRCKSIRRGDACLHASVTTKTFTDPGKMPEV